MNPGAGIRDYTIMYGKQTETAIAAVTFLAEIWQGPRTRRVSAADIADARGLQRPFVAKLLSALSQAGIVSGSPGPGGGYALAKDPADIRLRDVWLVFERPEPQKDCPFVGPACNSGSPCPLHARIQAVHDSINELLDSTTFDVVVDNSGEVVADAPKKVVPAATVGLSGNGAVRLNGNGLNGSGSNGNGSIANGMNGSNGTNGVNGHAH